MASHLYVVQRLNRWGVFERWASRRGIKDPAPGEVSSWWGPMVLDRNVKQQGLDSLRDVCPVDLEEALETREAVARLPEHLRETVRYEFVLRFGDQRMKANALGIQRRTLRWRLSCAYPLLLGFMNDVAAGLPREGAE